MRFSDEDALRNIAIIVARKSDYLRALRGSLPSAEIAHHMPSEGAALDEMLLRIVAELEPSLFMSRGETKAHKLNPNTKLEDLNQDMILEAIRAGLAR